MMTDTGDGELVRPKKMESTLSSHEHIHKSNHIDEMKVAEDKDRAKVDVRKEKVQNGKLK